MAGGARQTGCTRHAVLALIALAVGGACSDDEGDVSSIGTSESTAGRAAPTTDEPPPEPLRVAAFHAAIAATTEQPRLSYELAVTTSVPGFDDPIVNRSTGRFDARAGVGEGTRSFASEHPSIPASVRGAIFEFRALGETMWMLNPIGEPPQWSGFDIEEFGAAVGGDPLASVDIAGYLGLIDGAVTDVVADDVTADGTTTWTVRVRADELLPMVAAAGAGGRLEAVGAADSGIVEEMEVVVGADGLVVAVAADLDSWWMNAMREAADTGETATGELRVELTVGTFDTPLAVEPPCATTEREMDGGIEFQTCRAE